MKTEFLLIFLTLGVCFSSGCDRVQLRAKEAEASTSTETLLADEYLLDTRGGLFRNINWYEYSPENHIIWSLFDVYAIKTPSAIYKMQIQTYYDQSGVNPGDYELLLEGGPSLKSAHTLRVSAPGCGNPYTNPDFQACVIDPNQNVFTYLDLETLQSKKMTDAEALVEKEWDMAFKGTTIKLNSGISGPSQVVGALAKRSAAFFDPSGRAILANLQNLALQQQAREEFASLALNRSYLFYLPDGIDRVIHENYWYLTESDGTRQEKPDQWWLVRSHNGASFMKVNISAINDLLQATQFETEVILSYHLQRKGEPNFSLVSEQLNLSFNQENKNTSFCLNLEAAEVLPCSKERPDWDLKLVVLNSLKEGKWHREWRIFTNNGAIGPIDKKQIEKITSGHLVKI